jgi:pimeloyl-ACP methyl ester carboxylesterase
MWTIKLLLIPLFLYLAVVALVFAFQARILFPAAQVPPAGPLPPGAELYVLDTPGGERLHGVHIPPEAGRGGGRLLILGFGGNGWNGQDTAEYLHELFPEADVVAFHYRGYRPSGGAPSAAALIEDAPLIHDFAVAKLHPERVVAVGFSVGSGVAASLAGRRRLAGLILVTPFDSLEGVAAGHYPWLPVRWLFRHPMPAAKWLRGASVPTAILAGARDTLVPRARTDALREAVADLRFDRTLPGAGHNDIYQRSAFHQAMREALAAVVR